ncbi:cell cycle and apoptosis regulator protein 2 [Phalacrocorax aristotelis]|uniref:cell cycle and apoptosis regulator protein 2 n=1 Tax=Phalacrocorax aristotelis TaxID=126867 RepID=UPI003F4B0CD3
MPPLGSSRASSEPSPSSGLAASHRSFPGKGQGEEEESLLLVQDLVALSPRRWPRGPRIIWSKGRLLSIRQSKLSNPRLWTQAQTGPLDALLAFVYFSLNFCGYPHQREEELFGNLSLLPPAPTQVPNNIMVLNLGKLLEKAEEPDLPGEQNPRAGCQAGEGCAGT